MPSFVSLLAGLGLGFSLIIAIGAQNLFVLRQGMRREHIGLVIAICAVSDAVLIAVGISGLGAALQQLPWLVVAVRWVGAAFLIVYGLLAARRALARDHAVLETGPVTVPAPTSEVITEQQALGSRSSVTVARTIERPAVTASAASIALTCLALTWLNPHVYLDTVFLLGSIANTHGDARWAFGAGAAIASILWFTALGLGSRYLGRLLRSPRAWRVLDGAIAIVMIVLGVSLVLPH